MKNYLFLGMIGSALLFSSCSSNDDNSSESSKQKLVLSKVSTASFGSSPSPAVMVETYEYNSKGELIQLITKYGSINLGTITFEYSNNRPIKVKCYDNYQKLLYNSELSYTGNQLSKIEDLYQYTNDNKTYNFTYNSEGQLASTSFCQGLKCSNQMSIFYTYSKNNITEKTYQGQKNEYFYDNKLSPYTYMNQYIRIWLGKSYMDKLNNNNYTADKYSYIYNDKEIVSTTTFTYEYNSAGYPVKVIGRDNYGYPTIRYDYEYITL